MSGDGIENAAKAFESVIRSEPGKSTRGTPNAGGPPEPLFRNVGELEVDDESPSQGGGDDDDPEEILYGKKSDKTGSGDPRKGDRPDRDGDDDDGEGGKDESDDEDDDSDDDGSEEEDDEEDEDPELLAREVEVTVDGEPAKVTIKEALEGYVRTQTFHQRMNQLDEAKKIVRRAAGDAVQNYEYSMNLAKQMQAHMDTMIPKEPNWDEEFQKDPVKARELQRYYEKANGFRAQMQAQLDEARNRMEESNATQLKAFADEEAAKFEAANRKTWSDPKKKSKDLQSMRRTGLTHGFTEEELSQVYDSRMLQILLKASKYDRIMASKPKPTVTKPQGKPITPGTGSAKQRTVQKGVNSAMKRLNRTGRIDDAAVVFDQIIARGS
jgi:hypothetical protein